MIIRIAPETRDQICSLFRPLFKKFLGHGGPSAIAGSSDRFTDKHTCDACQTTRIQSTNADNPCEVEPMRAVTGVPDGYAGTSEHGSLRISEDSQVLARSLTQLS